MAASFTVTRLDNGAPELIQTTSVADVDQVSRGTFPNETPESAIINFNSSRPSLPVKETESAIKALMNA